MTGKQELSRQRLEYLYRVADAASSGADLTERERSEMADVARAVNELFASRRYASELVGILKRVVQTARSTAAAANCALVHRQLIGEARQVLEESETDREARYMELDALEQEDHRRDDNRRLQRQHEDEHRE